VEPILTEHEYNAVFLLWGRSEQPEQSRLGGRGRGYRTRYLLSPFLRCGKCNARLVGGRRTDRLSGEMIEMYRCPANGAGGCGGVTRVAAPVDAYIKALVIAEQQKVQFRKIEDLPPWPQAQELRDLQARIEDSTQRYEAGTYAAERYFPSLARMEAREAQLKREQRRYEGQREARRHTVANLAENGISQTSR
jgi:site-specific DNA recombinase